MGRPVQQVVEDVAHHPLAVDHIGDPAGQQTENARDAKGLAQLVVLVDQQGVGEVVAAGEALMTAGVVAADPPNLGPQGLQIGVAVAEGAGFHRAAGGVVLGIEEEHQGLAGQLVAAALNPVLILKGDQGSAITAL